MPVARFQLPDGRVARFEVPEGTTPEQAQSLIEAELPKLSQPAAASSEIPGPRKSAADQIPGTLPRVVPEGYLVDSATGNLREQTDLERLVTGHKKPSVARDIYQAARPYIAPTVEALGAAGGAVLGTPFGGPLGAIAGAGAGYATAKGLLTAADKTMGLAPSESFGEAAARTARDVLEGATFETGGRVAGQALGYVVGKVMDMRSIPKNKAAEIARNALGPDLPEVLNTLKASQGQGVSAAQATANINSPTWQALIDRATARDPRFLRALETSQGEISLNALAKLAGGATAAETRATTEAAKAALNVTQGPVREAALARANLGKAVAGYESEAQRLAAQAAGKVEDVRRLTALGEMAAEAAGRTPHVSTSGVRIGNPLVPGRYTYAADLAKKADEWASQAATGSLDLGQGARFSQAAADSLRSVGVKPLKGDQIIGSVRAIANNPEFAGNDLLLGAVTNVADDIAKWTSSGGVIDARALDAIRKNSINAAVQQLRPGVDATTQRNLAAEVMAKLKPTLIDAIESAGGTGYRQYLADYTKGMQQIAERKLTGEAARLWKTDKDAFVRLVQNESPDVVEKFLGSGNYNIATELSDNAMSVLRDQAQKRLTELSIKGQVSAGQDALKELLLQNMNKLRLPSYLSAVAATTNKALNILENKIGAKTMATLTESLKTPEGAARLLETLPAQERNKVLRLISDPSQWSENAKAMVRGTTAAGVNALAPERYDNNALVKQPVRIVETQE